MSYNFENPNNPISPEELTPYQSIEDFSEDTFNAAAEGETDALKTSSRRGFYRNLALDMFQNERVSLAGELLEEIEDQKNMKQDWESSIETAEKYLGRKIEEPDVNDQGYENWRSTLYDSTLSASLYRIYSIYKRELFPAAGPCKSEILGIITKEVTDKAERRRMFANYALTIEDKDYYPDSDEMLLTLIFMGCAFRKVFTDPLNGKPRGRHIKPQDFICDLNCTSLLSSQSLGYRYKQNKREIMQLQDNETYVKFALGMPADSETEESVIDRTAREEEGITLESMDNKNVYEVHERHVYLTKDKLKGVDELATDENTLYPYKVTILDRQVVEIKRNWREGDEIFTRIEHFVHYKFLPGIGGLFGVGLANLGGSNAIALTTMERMIINKMAANTFPGGYKSKIARSEDNIVNPGPNQFKEIDTAGMPLDAVVSSMPYPPADPLFFEIFKHVQQEIYNHLGVVDMNIPENSAQTPVGTSLIAYEIANRMMSASLSSIHNSLRYEFELLFGLWAESLPDEPYPFKVPGFEDAIMRTDFEDDINTVPVSDPNVLTSTHRLLQAQMLMRIADEHPDLYNTKEVNKILLEALNVENSESLLVEDPEPQSLDAVSENMLVLSGSPINVSETQNHPAHNTVHNILLQQLESDPSLLQLNPAAKFELTMHIQKHSAFDLINKIRMGDPEQGIPPNPNAYQDVEPDEYLTIPQIQNELTAMNADEGIKQMQEAEQLAAENVQVSPQQVMMEDISQRREAEQLRTQVALTKVEMEREMTILKTEFEQRMAEMKMQFEQAMEEKKTELESYKAQIKFEGDLNKMEAEKQIASEGNETALAVEQLKHNVIPGE